jgi:hypothetical protein
VNVTHLAAVVLVKASHQQRSHKHVLVVVVHLQPKQDVQQSTTQQPQQCLMPMATRACC